MRKKSKWFRAVGYVDASDYEKLTDALKKEEMSFSGWLRKTIKAFLAKSS